MAGVSDLERIFDDPDVFIAGHVRITFDDIVDAMASTPSDQWQVDTVRAPDGSSNCFFGHLFTLGERTAAAAPRLTIAPHGKLTPTEVVANALWEWFESCWSTTYVIYPVNDGRDPRYPQPTPKARVLAYLEALRSGEELRTQESMLQDFAAGAPTAPPVVLTELAT